MGGLWLSARYSEKTNYKVISFRVRVCLSLSCRILLSNMFNSKRMVWVGLVSAPWVLFESPCAVDEGLGGRVGGRGTFRSTTLLDDVGMLAHMDYRQPCWMDWVSDPNG